jgi:hypothetical protein
VIKQLEQKNKTLEKENNELSLQHEKTTKHNEALQAQFNALV